MLGDALTDGRQCDWFSEAAYRKDEQLLKRQPSWFMFSNHLIAVL